jgi:choline dehydrogenase-like flavoprotein
MSIRDFAASEGPALIETDVCIIGAGAAGISLARRLADGRRRILLVESGGMDFDPDTQDLYSGQDLGRPYFDLAAARLRYFGGSTNHWEGWCGPMDAADFEKQEWIAYSGWPISLEDLMPYYREAQTFNELGAWGYDDSIWSRFGMDAPPVDREKLMTYFWQFADVPVRYGAKFMSEDLRERIDVLLMANATDIRLDTSGKAVEAVEVKSLNGKSALIKARQFVLACGGIENPRLLLASNSVQTKGIGNDRDLVGRYFMEHPHVSVGRLVGPGLSDWMEHYNTFYIDKVKYQPGAQVTPDLRRALNIANVVVEFFPVEDPNAGLSALRRLRDAVSADNRDWARMGEDLWRVVVDLDDVARQAWRRIVQNRGAMASFSSLDLLVRSEQTPNPASRVLLVDERDALGMPRAGLEWRLNEIDSLTVKAAVDVVAAEAGRLGIGRVKLLESVEAGDWMAEMVGGWHHMGTTRMADDASRGVVDRNCRVHGIDNLYIAGSSVFTTGGFTNPTLTIVALAYRLADHLKTRLG